MIVKNEARVLARCLASVKPLIDHWIVCDTGSSDDSRRITREALAGIPGALYQDDWVNFGHNRTLAVRRARRKADYSLFINADETLHVAADFRPALSADECMIPVRGDLEYSVVALVKNRHDWSYLGPTHEIIYSPTARTRQVFGDAYLVHHCDGGSRSDKFDRDLRLLNIAISEEPCNPRYMFYLAETYRGIGLMGQALSWYAKRVEIGGWEEEIFYSLYQIARLQHLSTLPWQTVFNSYVRAWSFRPTRLEPLLPLLRRFREAQRYDMGYELALPLIDAPFPNDLLFIDRKVYDYEFLFEFALCCHLSGRYAEANRAYTRILDRTSIPDFVLIAADANRSRLQSDDSPVTLDLADTYTSNYFDSHRPWQSEYDIVADCLANCLQFSSVLDLGCGNAYLLARLKDFGKAVAGVDGACTAISAAPADLRPALRLQDLTRPVSIGSFDLTVCTEVAEHLPPQAADVLIDSICRSSLRFVYFTAATPGQGGVCHVNEQPHSYWIEKFRQRGFRYLVAESEALRRRLASSIHSITWFVRNSMIFATGSAKTPAAWEILPGKRL